MAAARRPVLAAPLAFAFALALALAGLACAARPPPGPTAPSVRVMRLSPLGGERVEVELRLGNPNESPLALAGYRFVLELEGARFAAGHAEAPLVLPRFGEGLASVVVRAERPELVRRLALPGAAEGFDYRIRGHVALGSGATLPFEQRGRLLGSGESY